MKFREIEERDIACLTDIARKGMVFDFFTEDIIREKTLAAVDYDPGLGMVCEYEGVVAGFAQCALGSHTSPPPGWIRLMVVHPVYRNRGIGAALLAECETRLKARGAQSLSTMNSVPNYFTPGIDHRYTESYCFFRKHGYERAGEGLNLVCDLSPERFELEPDIARLSDEGYCIKRAEPGDLDPVLDFVKPLFPAWEGEIREGFRNEPISIHICMVDSRVIGFAAFDTNNKNTGWFGPMGVSPETRGKGIGGLLCNLCMRDMALQGHRKSAIAAVGPVRFYSRVCQSRIDRLFWIWKKEL